MRAELVEINGLAVLVYPADGPAYTERDITDVIGDALGSGAEWVALPVTRLDEDFFALRTRVAGEIAQKFVNYRLRLAVLGDIAHHVTASTALRDFVYESNRGRQLWFLPDLAALTTRLTPSAGPA
ncbi:DUF4180 domain-containing protein [Catellatospora tritici]|uniref:DUF4180 domain-containing protein n=1 Tax=Catellatospora tritici TaxID=2851566 RepID=UPI001C2D0A3E|nr:DUF4180 domain-containing protein [Catellatospora tritici]MBV1852523.1 DUF4180 domain-containing protein [Catellatospora tritici]